MIIIPEGILEDALQNALEFVRKDYNDQVDKSNSVLARMFQGQAIGSYDFLDNMVKVIVTTDKDGERNMRIKHSWDPDDRKYPGVYLNMINENHALNSLGYGLGGGDEEAFYNGDDLTATEYSDIYNRRYDASYALTILSDNKNEVIGLYNFFKALITSIGYHLEGSCLQNFKLSGRGNLFNDNIPPGINYKVIEMSFNYQTGSPDFYSNIIPKDITLVQTLTLE